MNKLIGKTIAITVATIFGVIIVAFGAAALFAPKFLAETFYNMGAYSASVFFYEKNYEKTGEIDDLVLLIDKLDVQRDSASVEKYVSEMINGDGFDEYCLSFDDSERLIPLKDYYYGLYAQSLILNSKLNDAIAFCEQSVSFVYGEFNSYRAILSALGESLTVEQLTSIKNSIIGVAENLVGGELLVAQTDLLDIDNLILG